METLKELVKKYLKHFAVVIALGGGAYLTVDMAEDGTLDFNIATEETQ